MAGEELGDADEIVGDDGGLRLEGRPEEGQKIFATSFFLFVYPFVSLWTRDEEEDDDAVASYQAGSGSLWLTLFMSEPNDWVSCKSRCRACSRTLLWS